MLQVRNAAVRLVACLQLVRGVPYACRGCLAGPFHAGCVSGCCPGRPAYAGVQLAELIGASHRANPRPSSGFAGIEFRAVQGSDHGASYRDSDAGKPGLHGLVEPQAGTMVAPPHRRQLRPLRGAQATGPSNDQLTPPLPREPSSCSMDSEGAELCSLVPGCSGLGLRLEGVVEAGQAGLSPVGVSQPAQQPCTEARHAQCTG